MQQWKTMLVIGVMVLSGSRVGRAENYTWNAGNSTWGTAANWAPNTGYPQAADTAAFTGAVTRTITVGTQEVNTITVTGSAPWTWSAGKLTVGSLFDYSSSGTSTFNPALAGAGSLTVNAGRLNLAVSNYLSGAVTINAGTLASFVNTVVPLGTGPIYLGATSGSADATLLLAFFEALNNPITVRAGSSGRARIGTLPSTWLDSAPYGIVFGGPIVLEKDLALRDDALMANRYVSNERGYLYFAGPISGTGSVTKEGIGMMLFAATNSYVGTTTVNGGYLRSYATTSSVVGNYQVPLGTLIFYSDAGMGHVSNTVTVGGSGTIGGFGVGGAQWAGVNLNRLVEITGNGGFLRGRSGATVNMDGVISGSGRLLAASGNSLRLNADNTFSGGMDVVEGELSILAAGYAKKTYGTGNIRVLYGNVLHLRNANNVGAGATVLVANNGETAASEFLRSSIDLWTDALPLDPASGGIIMLRGGIGANINAAFATNAPQVGNGYMTLAGTTVSFTGASLQPNLDGVYRLGARNGGITLNAGAGARGVLTGTNAVQIGFHYSLYSTFGAGYVSLVNSNDFTGPVTVNRWSTLVGTAQPTAGRSPFGSSTGPVKLAGGALEFRGATGGQPMEKGVLTLNGSAAVTLTTNGFASQLTVSELVRSDRATLKVGIALPSGPGGAEKFLATTGVPSPSNGMIAPWIVGTADNGSFLNYVGGIGFTNAAVTATTLSGAGSNDVVTLAAAEAVPAGKQVYALKTGFAVNGPETLTLGSGGLILTGAVTHTAPLAFGGAEAAIYAGANNILSGSLSGSGGLTKFGPSELRLTGNNSGLSGGFTVNEGILGCTNTATLGGPGNTVTLNGGTLAFYGTGTTAFSNELVLAEQGGVIRPGGAGITTEFRGNISGTGALTVTGVQIWGTNNTYSGGTFVYYNGGQSGMNVASGSSLGTGPVIVYGSNDGTAGGNPVGLVLYGDNNLPTNATLTLGGLTSYALFGSLNPRMGSVQGNGMMILGNAAGSTSAALTLGLDNRSTEYFGAICDAHTDRAGASSGSLIKAGTGTFTLWGENTYSGGTVVTGGTLVVKNWLNTNAVVTVHPGATLDGIGTVGIVSNKGGTVKGNLYMTRLVMEGASTLPVTLNGTNALSQYGQFNVADGITLGGTLQLTLGFAPAVGQTFTILNNAGTVSGTFANGNNLTATYGGRTYYFSVNYHGGDGNDVVLTRLVTGTVITIR